MKRTLAKQNRLIDNLADALRFYGCGPDTDDLTGPLEWDDVVTFVNGHSGEGWYIFCEQYPDEGSVFVAQHEYGALLIAQTIVAEERAFLLREFALAKALLAFASGVSPLGEFEALRELQDVVERIAGKAVAK